MLNIKKLENLHAQSNVRTLRWDQFVGHLATITSVWQNKLSSWLRNNWVSSSFISLKAYIWCYKRYRKNAWGVPWNSVRELFSSKLGKNIVYHEVIIHKRRSNRMLTIFILSKVCNKRTRHLKKNDYSLFTGIFFSILDYTLVRKFCSVFVLFVSLFYFVFSNQHH